MEEVLPSHHHPRDLAPQRLAPRRFFALMSGDVLAIIEPDDKKSLTKKFREYRVACQAYHDGVMATIEVPHAVMANPLGSLADRCAWTLRADGKALSRGVPGTGSKVLVQCINGDPNNAVIVSGYRSDQDADDPAAQPGDLAYLWEYDGVRVEVDADGALTLSRNGPTTPDGELDADRSSTDRVGATVTMDADGGITVATTVPDEHGDPRDEQSVVIDHQAKTIAVTAKSGLTITVTDGPVTVRAQGDVAVTSDQGDVTATATQGNVTLAAPAGKVRAGAHADQPMVLGNELASWLNQLCQAIMAQQHPTAVGPSGPPLNAPLFAQLAAQIQTLLSRAADVAPAP